MKRIMPMLLFLFISASANATLWDRGNNLIYDDFQNITWYDYTYQAVNGWQSAIDWANSLIVANAVNWRLPISFEGVRGEYNQTKSEMGSLYYLSGISLFTNIYSWYYWSGSTYSADQSYAWFFSFVDGWQDTRSKSRTNYYALAVHDGDVGRSSVPEPSTIFLFFLGLIGLAGMKIKQAG